MGDTQAELTLVASLPPSPEEIAEKKELEELEAAGFKDWTRNDYSRFIKSAEKNGRDKLNDIAEDLLGTKKACRAVMQEATQAGLGVIMCAHCCVCVCVCVCVCGV